MKMKTCAALAVVALAGCQAYPDTPQSVVTVAGDYQSVGDCLYLGLSTAWVKTDLPSSKTVVLTLSDYHGTYARITAHQVEAGKTAVSVQAMANPGRFTKIINGCGSSSPAPQTPET